MDGYVSVGGVKIDDSVSYVAAACWADVIDNEIHVNFLSLWANGGLSKGSAKIVMLRGRTDTLRWHLNRSQYSKLRPAICRHLRVRYPQVIHRLPPAQTRRTTEFFKIEMGHLHCWWMERGQYQT